MPDERTYPCLPCRELDVSISFYEALGFTRTYRQLRPNPYAVVARGDLHIHLFGLEDFDPEKSYGNVIVVVPDADALYNAFVEGLRAVYQKLPTVGIPRILRPRKKYGTVSGFSVVDPGGNWLRVYKKGDTEEATKSSGLIGVLEVAARLGDAQGDDAKALKTIESGLAKHPEAPAIERARALLYRAELAKRVQNQALAEASLREVRALDLRDDERAELAAEIAHATEVVG